METQTKWLWKKTLTELKSEPFSLSYQLTLVTKEPLQVEHVTRALGHLFRKVPVLRTCLGERDGEIWLKEMCQEIIDFEMISDAKADELHERLQKYTFNKDTGPLWCIKLRPEPNCLPDGVLREKMEGFPHMYSVFMGISHIIVDGTTNAKICGLLVQLLDDVIGGKDIDDEEQLGIFISNTKTRKLVRDQEVALNADADLKRKLIEEYRARQEKRSMVKSLFTEDAEKEAKSVMLTRDIDTNTTAAFIKRCRAEKVTVNSAFTAVANLALLDILVERGVDQDKYSIRSEHVLNARRYWDGDTSQYLGCHVLSLMPIIIDTPRNAEEEFWVYAKSTNEKLHGKITSGKPLQEEVIYELNLDGPDPIFEFEFFVTNMGDLTNMIAKGGHYVQAVHVVRSSTLDCVPTPLLHLIHTFRGKLVLTLVYNKLFVTSRVAEKYYEKMFQLIQKNI